VSADAVSADEVRAALARLGAAWRERRWDALAGCLDERVVFAVLGAGRVEGRDAAVASYREFMERATITEYREEPPAVDVWGDTAVATYRWTMAWLSGGVPNRGTGHDVLVLRRADGAWRAVWRTLVADPEPPGGASSA
jgi:uncharacterized protein (TIGR02246 family)